MSTQCTVLVERYDYIFDLSNDVHKRRRDSGNQIPYQQMALPSILGSR